MFVAPWLGAFPLVVGLFRARALRVSRCGLSRAWRERPTTLREDFRRRALGAAAAVFALAGLALVVGIATAPRIARGVAGSAWAVPLHVADRGRGGHRDRRAAGAALRLARVAAAAQVTFILWGWVLAQYPFIIPPTLTIRDSAAPT